MAHAAPIASIPQTPPADWSGRMLSSYGPASISSNARTVLERRYLKTDSGIETPEQMFARVAWNIALSEFSHGATPEQVEEAAETFYALMHAGDFLPNSPTLMNAGRKLQQLSACFVLPVDDSMEGIFDAVKHTALIHKSGGGTGFSFSRLRPAGDAVGSTKGVSSGPISFMKVFDVATETIKQGGTRRGANMGILRVDHPDILDFIVCKDEKKAFNNFNISIALTEAFMKAVEQDAEYSLTHPRTGKETRSLRAREVFEKIVDAAWRTGEPGIVFIDRMNRDNPTPHAGAIESTNPCGEQPLLPYESCNLGSLNLSRFVTETDGKPAVDYTRMEKAVREAVRFLDDVIDANRYPLPEIDRVTKSNRKIGLGVMGWADLLIEMGIPYDTDEALALGEKVMGFIQTVSEDESFNLSVSRGSFPNFEESTIRAKGRTGMRNATTTTIAPTGTISIIAGASGGIEPLFALSIMRNVMDNDRLFEVHPAFERKMREFGLYTPELMEKVSKAGTVRDIAEIPADVRQVFRTAMDISPEAHLRMQAVFQQYTHNAVSKTVNLPESATREDVRKVYELAHSLGCKGVTVYRDKSRDEQVLNIGSVNEAPKAEVPASVTPRPRPDVLSGSTKELKTGCGRIYVTVNRDEKGLFEVFNQMGKAGGCASSQSEAIGRLVSLALRSGIAPETVAKQLTGISCHMPCGFGANKVTSCADAVAKAILSSVEAPSMIPAATATAAPRNESPAPTKAAGRGACPDCGGQLERVEGCVKCRGCGFSECG